MLNNLFRSRRLDKQISKYHARLYRLAASWCSDTMLVDDLVQETINKALIKQDQLKDFSCMEAWLFRILHNCWMEYLRSKKSLIDIDTVELAYGNTPEKNLTEQQVIYHVRRSIETLPLTHRQVITLVDLEASPYTQLISAHLAL